MPLLEPDPAKLRPRARPGAPAADRVPEDRAGGTPEPLRGDLVALLGAEKVLTGVSDLVRYASDASPYRFVPRVVVVPEDVDDVSAVLSYAHGKGREVVFRAAGTSLNGQAQGEDVLVDVRRHWTGVEILDGGARVRIAPGTTVARVNAALARHGRVLGPDPASAVACTVGGVVANNASGMTAGTTRNAYVTLASLTFVLPTGTVVDTAEPDADERLARAEPALCAGLMELKAEIEADAQGARDALIEAVAEALVFAAKAGADPAKVREALMGGFASSRILEVHAERMLKRTFDPGFRIELHQKDLGLALAGAKALGVALPNTANAQQLFSACVAQGEGRSDHSAMVKALELMANHSL